MCFFITASVKQQDWAQSLVHLPVNKCECLYGRRTVVVVKCLVSVAVRTEDIPHRPGLTGLE